MRLRGRGYAIPPLPLLLLPLPLNPIKCKWEWEWEREEDKQAPGEEPRKEDKENEEGDLETQLLQYNVFVLNATCEEMRKEMPHLMMRICGAGVPRGDRKSVV